MKTSTCWIVINRSGHMVPSTVAPHRTQSIKRMVGDEEGWQNRWRYWKRNYGNRCIRVELIAHGGAGEG